MDKITKSGLSISSFMLHAALAQEIVIVEEVKDFNKQLLKIGNNLNQLTILAHKGNISTVNLNETKEVLTNIYKELTRIRR